jgi:aspartate dehydrogenase
VLVREARLQRARAELPEAIAVVTGIHELLTLGAEIVLECASQDSLATYGEAVLASGTDLVVISTGALADDGLRHRLAAAAEAGGSRLIVGPGAIGGLDALGALRLGGLTRVGYTSIKPPHAWRGTPAEAVVDLGSLVERAEVFRGSAREAARRFPKNANLAITVALAAGALDETVVTLVADPGVSENIGIIEAEGSLGTLTLELRGPASADNPRTSAVTAFSLVNELERRSASLVV